MYEYKGYESNFNMYTANQIGQHHLGYDYASVMHYSRTAFSKNGQDTIQPITIGPVIGQRSRLSDTDILEWREAYNCK